MTWPASNWLWIQKSNIHCINFVILLIFELLWHLTLHIRSRTSQIDWLNYGFIILLHWLLKGNVWFVWSSLEMEVLAIINSAITGIMFYIAHVSIFNSCLILFGPHLICPIDSCLLGLFNTFAELTIWCFENNIHDKDFVYEYQSKIQPQTIPWIEEW